MTRWWLLLSLSIVGCVPPYHATQRRFASEFDCPLKQTKKKSLGAGAYRIKGCGRVASYVCTRTGPYNLHPTVCVRELEERTYASAPVTPSPEPPSPRGQVRRKQEGSGGAVLEAFIPLSQGSLELRGFPSSQAQSMAVTLKAAMPIDQCRLDLVINGVRREVPEPKRGSDPRRFFLELPLSLLADMATSARVVARVCTTTWDFDGFSQAILAELLMRFREETAFDEQPAWNADEPAPPPAATGSKL